MKKQFKLELAQGPRSKGVELGSWEIWICLLGAEPPPSGTLPITPRARPPPTLSGDATELGGCARTRVVGGARGGGSAPPGRRWLASSAAGCWSWGDNRAPLDHPSLVYISTITVLDRLTAQKRSASLTQC